jgi:hypothetical protein
MEVHWGCSGQWKAKQQNRCQHARKSLARWRAIRIGYGVIRNALRTTPGRFC